MHLIISHNCLVYVKVVGFVCFGFFEKRGSKEVNMDFV